MWCHILAVASAREPARKIVLAQRMFFAPYSEYIPANRIYCVSGKLCRKHRTEHLTAPQKTHPDTNTSGFVGSRLECRNGNRPPTISLNDARGEVECSPGGWWRADRGWPAWKLVDHNSARIVAIVPRTVQVAHNRVYLYLYDFHHLNTQLQTNGTV